MRLTKILGPAALAAALCAVPLTSQAALILCLDDGVGGFNGGGSSALCVSDGGAGDTNTAAGAITFIGSYGGFTINVSTALGTEVLGFGLDLNSVNFGTGTLVIAMSESDLNFGAAGSSTFGSAIGGVAGGTLAYDLYADDANALFGTGTSLFSGSTGAGAFAASGSGTFAASDPFSLSLFVTLVHGSGTYGFAPASSFNFEAKVPEPGTLGLLGLGLLGLGVVSRRRARA